MSATSHPAGERMSEYLDGGLAPVERAALEAHVAGRADCSATLAGLRAVVERAALERGAEHAPATDLWPGIAARLAPRRAAILRPAAGWRGFRVSFALPQLAAAALALMLLSAGTVWLVVGRRAPAPVAPRGPSTSSGEAALIGPDAALADFGFTRYDAAIADLERVLAEHRNQLDPATVRVVEENLRIIDQATQQALKALKADPSNPYLNDHVADQMRRKVELLRQVTSLIHA